MTDDALPYGDESVNKTIRPFKKIVPFRKPRVDLHRFQTYSNFWKREDLSGEEKALIHEILAHTDKNGESWPTHPQLCRMMKVGHCKLERMLRKLRTMGEISWVHFNDKWGHRRNKYVVLSFRKLANPTPTNELLATPSKPVVKHITRYSKDNTVQDQVQEYGGL